MDRTWRPRAIGSRARRTQHPAAVSHEVTAWCGIHTFRVRGWEPDYPETTGYIIPTLYMIADHLNRPDFAERAERAARWESEVQLSNGGVRAGVMGQPPLTSVFNTGQVIFGWLAAFDRTGEQRFMDSAMRAGEFLAERIDDDGIWRRDASHLAHQGATLYNTRTAWALAEAGKRFGVRAFVDAARLALLAAVQRQHADGWIPDCCMLDPERPLLHALAYAIRGSLEGGWLLGDDCRTQSGDHGRDRPPRPHARRWVARRLLVPGMGAGGGLQLPHGNGPDRERVDSPGGR